MDLDQVADELYALPPGEFTAARDGRAAEARVAGDAGLSAAIKKLRKPTLSAWLANVLVRERAGDVDRLLELGSGLRVAQRALAGDRLRDLSRQRHEVVVALGREGQRIGRRAGVPVSDAAADELEGTLEAAMADPAAGEALRSGRLTSALRYSGTGLGEISSTAATRARPRPDRRPDDGQARQRRAGAMREAASAAKRASRRADAVRELAADVGRELDEVRSSLERAQAEVERLEREAATVEKRAAEAERRLQDAEREERAARRRLEELQIDGR